MKQLMDIIVQKLGHQRRAFKVFIFTQGLNSQYDM